LEDQVQNLYPNRFRVFFIVALLVFLLIGYVRSEEVKKDERYFVNYIAATRGWAKEVQYPFKGSRVDLEDNEYAYEVDWAYKRDQAIGQALRYAYASKKKPAIILLYTDDIERFKYTDTVEAVCWKAGIKVEWLYVGHYLAKGE
jgi:hypothetical protein